MDRSGRKFQASTLRAYSPTHQSLVSPSSPRLTTYSDPSKVPTAKLLSSIDPREANELTHVYALYVTTHADHATAFMAPK